MIIDCDNSTTTTSTPAMICMRNTVHITHLRRGGRCLTAGGISPKFCISGATPQVFHVFVHTIKNFYFEFLHIFHVFVNATKKIKNFCTKKKPKMNLITLDLKYQFFLDICNMAIAFQTT